MRGSARFEGLGRTRLANALRFLFWHRLILDPLEDSEPMVVSANRDGAFKSQFRYQTCGKLTDPIFLGCRNFACFAHFRDTPHRVGRGRVPRGIARGIRVRGHASSFEGRANNVATPIVMRRIYLLINNIFLIDEKRN